MYLIIYSVGGFVLERIINVLFLDRWYDNSVLIGPYQPLYGSGILLTIIFYDLVYTKLRKTKPIIKDILLIIAAIVFTGLAEAITGFGFKHLYGVGLWNYSNFFPCKYAFVCIYPTSLFGVMSYLVVRYLHPQIKRFIERVNNYLYYAILLIFIIDIILTLILLSK